MTATLPLSQAQLVLASASPRRVELLQQLGLRFEVLPSQVDEEAAAPADAGPGDLVQALALAKAQDVARLRPEADLVLGADTVVVLGHEVLGKPRDVAEACAMLGRLAGRWHTVYTGQALVAPGSGRVVQAVTTSEVRLAALSPEAIARYVATGEPMDKAGSYAIQGIGAGFVEANQGCYTTIVGLGLPTFLGLAKQLSWDWP